MILNFVPHGAFSSSILMERSSCDDDDDDDDATDSLTGLNYSRS